MHTLKAVLTLAAVLSTGGMLAQAQDGGQSQTTTQAPAAQREHHGHHKANPEKMAAHLAKKLNLSADQQAQIKPILADRQQQMQALRGDTSLSQQDRLAKARAIQQDSKSKIEAVLNDQHKQQFEQMLADRRAHHKEHKAA